MSPLNESTNTLLLLAEASLERLPACSPTSRGCGDTESHPGGDSPSLALSNALFQGSALRPRPSSRLSLDSPSSRSTSPSGGAIVPGRTYRCIKCSREYASTDAVRKHARQNHANWLRDQGQGCPSLYCIVIDSPLTATATGPNRAPSSLGVSTPPPLPPQTIFSAEDPSLLYTATESLFALSKAAPTTPDDEFTAEPACADEYTEGSLLWAPAPLPRAGQKRPRSVRCGRCDGCMREDCGTCKNCVDKPKFGGLGQRKQGCVKKVCCAPRVATG